MSLAEAIKNKPFSKTEMIFSSSENFSKMRKDVCLSVYAYVLMPNHFIYFWKFDRILYSGDADATLSLYAILQ